MRGLTGWKHLARRLGRTRAGTRAERPHLSHYRQINKPGGSPRASSPPRRAAAAFQAAYLFIPHRPQADQTPLDQAIRPLPLTLVHHPPPSPPRQAHSRPHPAPPPARANPPARPSARSASADPPGSGWARHPGYSHRRSRTPSGVRWARPLLAPQQVDRRVATTRFRDRDRATTGSGKPRLARWIWTWDGRGRRCGTALAGRDESACVRVGRLAAGGERVAAKDAVVSSLGRDALD